jgi:uncharacterized protein involved in type VI secretion and phage assembly
LSAVNEQAILDVLDRIRSRFYGKYRGTVTDVETPVQGARIKATVPAVLGNQPTGWCHPCVPYAGNNVGIAFLPDIGAGVWIEFEGGDVSYPIWSGCYWRDGEMPSNVAPGTMVIQTTSGHQIVLDDNAGSVTVTDAYGNSIKLDQSGITLQSANAGGRVELTDSEVNINNSNLEVQV